MKKLEDFNAIDPEIIYLGKIVEHQRHYETCFEEFIVLAKGQTGIFVLGNLKSF